MVELYRRVSAFGDLNDQRNRAKLIRAIGHYANISWKEREDEEWIPGLSAAADQIAASAQPTYAGVLDGIYSFYAKQQGARRWGDKTPGYVDTMREIREIFPNVRFIHIIRDGRDVGASLLPMSFGPNSAYIGALKWRKCVRHGLNFAQQYPDQTHTIRYEDLIDEPEKHLREICAFLGEDYDPAMMNYYKDGMSRMRLRPAAENMHTNISQPPNRSRAGRWKKDLSASQVRIFEAIAGDLLEELGYERSMPNARLKPYDKVLGKALHRVRVLRPFTKPSGLWERTTMAINKSVFFSTLSRDRT